MKRIVLSLILSLAALTAAENLHAQGLQGLLNLFANTKAAKADPAAGERLTAEQLTSPTWVYSSPQIVYSGNSSMATVAIASLRTQMPEMAKALGLNAGSDTVRFQEEGIAAMQNGQNKASVPYTYDHATGTVTFTVTRNGTATAFPATAASNNGVLTILFDADTTMETLLRMAPELKDDTYFSLIKAVVEKYPGIRIGATFKEK